MPRSPGFHLTEDHKKKLAEACWHPQTPETREKLRQIAIKRWEEATPEQKNRQFQTGGETYLETLLYDLLDDLGLYYFAQHWIGRSRVDAYIPSINLIIEVDGERWHTDPEHDRQRDERFKGLGYRIVHCKEVPFEKDPLETLLQAVREERRSSISGE